MNDGSNKYPVRYFKTILILGDIPEEACLTIGHEHHSDFFKIDSIAVSTHIILQPICNQMPKY